MLLKVPINESEPLKGKGSLYVVATPIGNRADITIRALETLKEVDFIAAEDTRRTGRLLSFYKIENNLVSYHEHNETRRTPDLIKRLHGGLSVALVTDAGTPSVSDPGYRLVKEAVANKIKVIPIPGVSAVAAAVSVSGLPSDSFVFVGFLKRKKSQRHLQIDGFVKEDRSIIVYESPKRVVKLLEELIDILGDRVAVLSREMTKLHEEFIRGTMSEILEEIKNRTVVKGECTLLIAGPDKKEDVSIETIRNEIKQKLQMHDNRISVLAKEISIEYKVPRKKIYAEAVRIKEELESFVDNTDSN